MICCFCRTVVASVAEAVDAGWTPDFWHAGLNYEGPVCPVCCRKHLAVDAHGEADLRPGATLPGLAVPLTKPAHRGDQGRTP